MSFQSEWAKRWADMPTVQLTSYMCPSHDGDMAELHELADRVLTYPARHVDGLRVTYVGEPIYHLVADKLGFSPTMLGWHDKAGEVLKRWRDE